MKIVNEPIEYATWFDEIPSDLVFLEDQHVPKDFIHYFTKSTSQLDSTFPKLKKELSQSGSLWISWPKKQSKVATDLDGNIVRQIGLSHGLVDVKVCSVNEVWSGLKFMYRLRDRT